MTDYGREVRFGYFPIPNAADPLLATAQAVRAQVARERATG